MNLPWVRVAGLVLTATALPGCSWQMGDTGFTGTWERRLTGGYSSLSIHEAEDGYQVSWSKIDGKQTVRCDDEGNCEEFVGEEKVYEWRFRAFSLPDSGDLFLEVTGSPIDEQASPLSYKDRLVLQPGGLELFSYQIEENGVEKDPSATPVVFRKISDRPL